MGWQADVNRFLGISPKGAFSAIPYLGDAIRYTDEAEQQGYDRNLTAEIMDREDTAVSRRADDMRFAGINPIMAAGAAAQTGGMSRSSAPEASAGKSTLDAIGVATSAAVAKADISRTKAQTDLAKAQVGKVEAETAASTGGEARAGELHDYSLEFARLKNGSIDVQNRFLMDTFDNRVAEGVARLESAQLNLILERQRRILNVYSIGEAEQRELEYRLLNAWRSGEKRFTPTGSAFKAWTGTVGGGGFARFSIDLSSLRNPLQVEVLSNQLALEMSRIALSLSKKEQAWFAISKISALIQGSARSYSQFVSPSTRR